MNEEHLDVVLGRIAYCSKFYMDLLKKISLATLLVLLLKEKR